MIRIIRANERKLTRQTVNLVLLSLFWYIGGGEKCDSLRIGSWNIKKLSSSIDDEDFINLVENFDLFFVCETWQKSKVNFSISEFD